MHRLLKKCGGRAEEAKRIDKAARKRNVRMQLITAAVFAVGKILGYASTRPNRTPKAAGVFDFKGIVNVTFTDVIKLPSISLDDLCDPGKTNF